MTRKSLEFIGADAVHAAPFDERGAGAVIAVLDDGIDLHHACFRDNEGKSRILRVWDQSGAPQSAGVPFGRVYEADEIADLVSTGGDASAFSSAHGTHVASIAAGRRTGSVDDPTAFAGGVAPDASLIVVQADRTQAGSGARSMSAHIMALDFIDQTLAGDGRPVVVNMSIGLNTGAHDGTSLFETAVDEFTQGGQREGCVIVKSAGNEGTHQSHTRQQFVPNEVGSIRWNSRNVERTQDLVELWFHGSDTFEFRLHQPSDLGEGTSDFVSADAPEDEGILPNGCHYRITYLRFHRQNGDSQVIVTINANDQGRIAGGEWKLEVRAAPKLPSGGRILAWLERDDRRPIKFRESSGKQVVTIPGTARSVLTIGACSKEEPLRALDSSSRGPTRDGRPKPEIAAPGIDIEGAKAGGSTAIVSKSGTSMSAAHVSGAVALMLSYCARTNRRQLTSSQVRAYLTQFAKGYSGNWQDRLGYGCLDVHAVFRELASG